MSHWPQCNMEEEEEERDSELAKFANATKLFQLMSTTKAGELLTVGLKRAVGTRQHGGR